MHPFQFTRYFEEQVLPRRPYLQKRWCVLVVQSPVRVELQGDGRIRFWGSIPGLPGYYLRVVTLEDGLTIHNAFLDRRFRP